MEHDAVLGDPDHRVVGGVTGGTGVDHLDTQVVDEVRDPVGEGEERRRDLDVAPLDVGPERCGERVRPKPSMAGPGGPVLRHDRCVG